RGIALPDGRRRRVDEVADASDVEDEPLRRVRGGLTSEAGNHARSVRTGTDVPLYPAARSSGGASAWQIATASASAAWCGVGGSESDRIIFTIRCIWAFSARP